MNARSLQFCAALVVGLTVALAASDATAQWSYLPYGGASAYAAASSWGGSASAAAYAQSGYGGFYPTPYYVSRPYSYYPYYGGTRVYPYYGWSYGRPVYRYGW